MTLALADGTEKGGSEMILLFFMRERANKLFRTECFDLPEIICQRLRETVFRFLSCPCAQAGGRG